MITVHEVEKEPFSITHVSHLMFPLSEVSDWKMLHVAKCNFVLNWCSYLCHYHLRTRVDQRQLVAYRAGFLDIPAIKSTPVFSIIIIICVLELKGEKQVHEYQGFFCSIFLLYSQGLFSVASLSLLFIYGRWSLIICPKRFLMSPSLFGLATCPHTPALH